MNIGMIILLAVIQGLAELLPVSSSAHVIFAEHLLGLDPSAPEMTFLLVMLHTGTMFAVLIYFWKRWTKIFENQQRFKNFFINTVIATITTGVLGLVLKVIIEKLILEKHLGYQKGEIEQIFSYLPLIAICLALAGALIFISGWLVGRNNPNAGVTELNRKQAVSMGLIQGLVLPFRGFSRSGATISLGMLMGVNKDSAEEFSFALAVALTPAVLWHEGKRFLQTSGPDMNLGQMIGPGLLGMVVSFCAGLLALRWLSQWLEKGRWYFFGIYCLGFSAFILMFSFL